MAYSSCSFHPEGANKSRMHMSVSMAAKSKGSKISVTMMIKKSMPTFMMVVSIPDLISIFATSKICVTTVLTTSTRTVKLVMMISWKMAKNMSRMGGTMPSTKLVNMSSALVRAFVLNEGVAVAPSASSASRRAVARPKVYVSFISSTSASARLPYDWLSSANRGAISGDWSASA